MHLHAAHRQGRRPPPRLGGEARRGGEVERHRREQRPHPCQMRPPRLAGRADAAAQAVWRRGGAMGDAVAQQPRAGAAGAVIMRPEHRLRRAKRRRQLGHILRPPAMQGMHRQQPSQHAGQASEAGDDIGDPRRPQPCPVQDHAAAPRRILDRGEAEARPQRREVQIGGTIAVELALLVGDQQLRAAGHVRVAVVTDRQHQPARAGTGGGEFARQRRRVQRNAARGEGGVQRQPVQLLPPRAAGRPGAAPLLPAAHRVVPQRINARRAHVRVGAQVVFGGEERARVATFAPAHAPVMLGRRHAGVAHIGVARQIERGIDMRGKRAQHWVHAGSMRRPG